jgi:hypothetical protein
MTVTKVLIDGEAGLNIIFLDTLRKMGLEPLFLSHRLVVQSRFETGRRPRHDLKAYGVRLAEVVVA